MRIALYAMTDHRTTDPYDFGTILGRARHTIWCWRNRGEAHMRLRPWLRWVIRGFQ